MLGIEDLVQRCERGLLSYGLYSIEQLRQFAKDRRLSQSGTQKDLVKRLEKADDDSEFGKVLGLASRAA